MGNFSDENLHSDFGVVVCHFFSIQALIWPFALISALDADKAKVLVEPALRTVSEACSPCRMKVSTVARFHALASQCHKVPASSANWKQSLSFEEKNSWQGRPMNCHSSIATGGCIFHSNMLAFDGANGNSSWASSSNGTWCYTPHNVTFHLLMVVVSEVWRALAWHEHWAPHSQQRIHWNILMRPLWRWNVY